MEPVFEANQVEKRYRSQQVLSSCSMQVPKGGIYGFVGENGAGKTTMIRLLAGLDFPTGGELLLFGSKDLRRQRARAGFIIETPALYLDMTAQQNMEMVRLQRGIPEKERISALLEQLSLKEAGKKRVRNFSLGMRQRLGLAMALLGSPEFLVLDEPINGLDPTGILEVRMLLKKLNQEQGTTILISSHILAELDNMATNYGFLHKGKMLQEISAKALAEKCRRYLLLRVENPTKAAALLEIRFPGANLEVYPDQSIHAYDLLGREAEASRFLTEQGIPLWEMAVCGDSLESYYSHLIGGEAL